MSKPRIVIEIKDGSLFSAYADSEVEFVLVDHDEAEGIAATVIDPDWMDSVPCNIKAVVEDAIRRSRP